MLIISILFFILAGISEGVMDTLQFHYHNSVFSKLDNQLFWNPQNSWMNKYKDGNPSMGEKFWGSKTLFVGLTDAWHLFKLFRNLFIFLGVFFIALTSQTFMISLMNVIVLRVSFGVSFTLSYKALG
jgi:hypothetical protein